MIVTDSGPDRVTLEPEAANEREFLAEFLEAFEKGGDIEVIRRTKIVFGSGPPDDADED
jgi:hypothetical protein